jgi:hypothetical protein
MMVDVETNNYAPRRSKTGARMSALGHKRTSPHVSLMRHETSRALWEAIIANGVFGAFVFLRGL